MDQHADGPDQAVGALRQQRTSITSIDWAAASRSILLRNMGLATQVNDRITDWASNSRVSAGIPPPDTSAGTSGLPKPEAI